jgi:hypothetical protein
LFVFILLFAIRLLVKKELNTIQMENISELTTEEDHNLQQKFLYHSKQSVQQPARIKKNSFNQIDLEINAQNPKTNQGMKSLIFYKYEL